MYIIICLSFFEYFLNQFFCTHLQKNYDYDRQKFGTPKTESMKGYM